MHDLNRSSPSYRFVILLLTLIVSFAACMHISDVQAIILAGAIIVFLNILIISECFQSLFYLFFLLSEPFISITLEINVLAREFSNVILLP